MVTDKICCLSASTAAHLVAIFNLLIGIIFVADATWSLSFSRVFIESTLVELIFGFIEVLFTAILLAGILHLNSHVILTWFVYQSIKIFLLIASLISLATGLVIFYVAAGVNVYLFIYCAVVATLITLYSALQLFFTYVVEKFRHGSTITTAEIPSYALVPFINK
jgi:hypothetical protein